MTKCKICDAIISEDEIEALKKFGFKNIPKMCEKCRRENRSYRLVLPSVKRERLEQYEGVQVESCYLVAQEGHETGRRKENFPFAFGGRGFGKTSWAGVRFSDKILIYVHKSFVLDGTNLEFKDKLVDIRKMKKIVNIDGKEKENIYFVFEPSKETEPNMFLYYTESYYKTTLKGHGRDRKWDYTIEDPYISLLKGWTWSNSGRFGNTFELVLSPEPIQIQYEGTP